MANSNAFELTKNPYYKKRMKYLGYIFWLVDTLSKIRQIKNKVINGQERNRRHFIKDAFFNI